MSYPRKDSSESSQELAPEYTDKPPIDDDQQPEYADEPLHEYEGEAPSEGSRMQKVRKTICVTTSSALMVIAGAFVMFLFSLMSAYWLLSTWPLFHIGWQALSVVYYSMSASFLIVLLLYPWLALAGDVRFGNSRLLLAGVIPLHVLGLAISGVWIGIYFAFLDHSAVIQYFMVLGFFVLFLSIGVFETNALQYGRDVLGDINSPELSAFIHWYYWATRLPTFLAGTAVVSISGGIAFHVFVGVAPLPVLILLIVLTVSCVLHCVHRKRHDVTAQQRITKNPVTLVHRVTQYALQSPTSPGHRGFLARLNNARQSKGGPADDEDVDNVTKFLFLVLLMASLFGFFFWDDMWAMSFISYVIHANINNRGDFYWPIYAFMSSQVATSAVVAICVPIYQCIIRPFMGKRSFPLLWRIFVGLVLQLASLALLTWIGATTTSRLDSDELSEFCDYSRIDGASRPDNEGELTSWYILAIPQLINGISHLLVIPAVLELILTDAPRIMQGLLIGLWYSMQSIHVLVSIIETATCAVFYWQYYLMKISLVLLSIIAFGVVSWFYKRNQVMRINRATSMQSQNQVVANNEDTC